MTAKRELFLMRHGHSPMGNNISDMKREIDGRGEDEVAESAIFARDHGLIPDVIICSEAERAKLSAEHFCNISGCEANTIFMKELYLAPADDILELLATLPEELNAVLVIAHNMGLENLLLELVQDDRTGKHRMLMNTASYALFSVDCESWADVEPENSTLLELFHPQTP